jgi:hypothetical protein
MGNKNESYEEMATNTEEKNSNSFSFSEYKHIYGEELIRLINKKKIEEEKKQQQQPNEWKFNSNECLLDPKKSTEVLKKYGLSADQLDENMRFILGPCNPVLMIPGLYSTRLMLSIDCKKFSENKNNLADLRLFCGNTICKKDFEEHVIWPSLFDSPFILFKSQDVNKYSACFGYFFKYHKINECPELNTEQEQFLRNEQKSDTICLNNNAVKLTFYGATPDTKSKSQCGAAAIKNIVSIGSLPLKESWFNSGGSKAYEEMYNRYSQMGYKPGFSMGGLPYDFRRFISTNNLFKNFFEDQIERLYSNTGKPVVLVAHSFGSLNTLSSLLSSNKDLLKKIKKFIAVGPPFAGATKVLELYLHGNREFNQKFSLSFLDLFNVELDDFGQKLSLASTPVAYELKPNSILYRLFKNSEYSNFKSALEEIFLLEKICKSHDCNSDFVDRLSQNFTKVFENFPKLNDAECLVSDILKNPKYQEIIKQYINDPKLDVPSFLPCRNDFFDSISCPTVKIRNSPEDKASDIESKHCHLVNSGNGSPVADDSDFFNRECNIKTNCVEKFYNKHYAYPYSDKKMADLIDRFNKTYSNEFPGVDFNISSYFDSKEVLQMKIEKMMEHQNSVTKIENLDIPEVDTIIVYGSYLPTKSAYLFDEVINLDEFSKNDILMKGGDGTVPSWSSMLTGMKWLFDKKAKNLPQNIQLVEFCSTLSKKGGKYSFDPSNLNKEFSAISCDCLDSDNFYDFKKTSNFLCDHGNTIGDSHLIKFVEYYLQDESNSKYEEETLPEDKKLAVKNYNSKFDYEQSCNDMLMKLDNEL